MKWRKLLGSLVSRVKIVGWLIYGVIVFSWMIIVVKVRMEIVYRC